MKPFKALLFRQTGGSTPIEALQAESGDFLQAESGEYIQIDNVQTNPPPGNGNE